MCIVVVPFINDSTQSTLIKPIKEVFKVTTLRQSNKQIVFGEVSQFGGFERTKVGCIAPFVEYLLLSKFVEWTNCN